MTPSPVLEAMRRQASAIYATGAVPDAIVIQRQVLLAARSAGAETPDDSLFLGLMLHATGQLDDGVCLLRDGIARFPAHAALHENLGVFLLGQNDVAAAIEACQTALKLGSASPNVLDCLADAFNRLGQTEAAIAAGQDALQAKDRRFGARAPLAMVPDRPPPPFNPLNPAENVIAYSLWGEAPRYRVPLLENARILAHLFPGWTMRVYHDAAVDDAYLDALAGLGVDLVPMTLPPSVPSHRRLLWRFGVIAEPTVRRFLIRDADSLLSVKERVAVDAWLASRFHFHAMRDWFTHTDLLLAGMWGGVGGILPAPEALFRAYTGWRVENDHLDQDLLAETVWPIVRRDVLIHDSVFTGCLGSVAFPPYGALPPGTHIGQNAFSQVV